MKKFLILLVCVFTGLSTVGAEATVKNIQPVNAGSFQVAGHTTVSLATNAIDTLEVGPINIASYFRATGAAADTTAALILIQASELSFAFEGLTGTGGSGTVDSMQVAVDFSDDGQNWTQVSALGNLMTNTLPTRNIQYKFCSTCAAGLKSPPAFVRLRYKNTGAATGRGHVTAKWVRAF